MSGAAAVAIANGALRGGLLLLALTAIPDVLDGAVAKASGTASARGAFFDSTMDRVADALLLGGVAWYLQTTEPGHISLLPMAVLGASLLISYERAKAEALGLRRPRRPDGAGRAPDPARRSPCCSTRSSSRHCG